MKHQPKCNYTYQIKVTKNDIKDGHPHSQYFCPIALAAKRLSKEKFLEVGTTEITFRISSNDRGSPHIKLPPEAQFFIKSFDGDKNVNPFSFKIQTSFKL